MNNIDDFLPSVLLNREKLPYSDSRPFYPTNKFAKKITTVNVGFESFINKLHWNFSLSNVKALKASIAKLAKKNQIGIEYLHIHD